MDKLKPFFKKVNGTEKKRECRLRFGISLSLIIKIFATDRQASSDRYLSLPVGILVNLPA